MKARILIEQLQKLVNEHGDLEVGRFVDECCTYTTVTKTGTKETVHTGTWFESDDDELTGKFITLN